MTWYFEHFFYSSKALSFYNYVICFKDNFRNTNFHIMWEIIVKGTRGGNQHLYHQQLLCDCYNHLLKIENEGVFNRYLRRCNFALLTKNKNHDYYMVKKCKSLGYISPTLKNFAASVCLSIIQTHNCCHLLTCLCIMMFLMNLQKFVLLFPMFHFV